MAVVVDLVVVIVVSLSVAVIVLTMVMVIVMTVEVVAAGSETIMNGGFLALGNSCGLSISNCNYSRSRKKEEEQ